MFIVFRPDNEGLDLNVQSLAEIAQIRLIGSLDALLHGVRQKTPIARRKRLTPDLTHAVGRRPKLRILLVSAAMFAPLASRGCRPDIEVHFATDRYLKISQGLFDCPINALASALSCPCSTYSPTDSPPPFAFPNVNFHQLRASSCPVDYLQGHLTGEDSANLLQLRSDRTRACRS